MRQVKHIMAAVLGCFVLVTSAIAGNQMVAGAGPSTGIVKLFFSEFSKHPACAGINFNVIEMSVKHAGGIKNSDTFLFGRTGRPLKPEEKDLGKEEILLGEIPIAFAKGLEVGVEALDFKQIEKIFNRDITNWQEVGGPDAPIFLVGREKNEAVFSVLRNEFPFFNNTNFDQVLRSDDEVVQFLSSPAGRHALAFGGRSNIKVHNLLQVSGFSSGVKVGLVFDQKNASHPVIKAAQEFSASPQWSALITQNGFSPLR